jgi:hypothetical protein
VVGTVGKPVKFSILWAWGPQHHYLGSGSRGVYIFNFRVVMDHVNI